MDFGPFFVFQKIHNLIDFHDWLCENRYLKKRSRHDFLEAHENLSIYELISSLKNSLDNHNKAAILALCFIIPDLLSKIWIKIKKKIT